MDTTGTPSHEPVLVREVLDLLAPAFESEGGGWSVDALAEAIAGLQLHSLDEPY